MCVIHTDTNITPQVHRSTYLLTSQELTWMGGDIRPGCYWPQGNFGCPERGQYHVMCTYQQVTRRGHSDICCAWSFLPNANLILLFSYLYLWDIVCPSHHCCLHHWHQQRDPCASYLEDLAMFSISMHVCRTEWRCNTGSYDVLRYRTVRFSCITPATVLTHKSIKSIVSDVFHIHIT